jgi:hypothetical protein
MEDPFNPYNYLLEAKYSSSNFQSNLKKLNKGFERANKEMFKMLKQIEADLSKSLVGKEISGKDFPGYNKNFFEGKAIIDKVYIEVKSGFDAAHLDKHDWYVKPEEIWFEITDDVRTDVFNADHLGFIV